MISSQASGRLPRFNIEALNQGSTRTFQDPRPGGPVDQVVSLCNCFIGLKKWKEEDHALFEAECNVIWGPVEGGVIFNVGQTSLANLSCMGHDEILYMKPTDLILLFSPHPWGAYLALTGLSRRGRESCLKTFQVLSP